VCRIGVGLRPGSELVSGCVNKPLGSLEDQDGFARAWQLKATAICASA
jgi:hypothetical protein